MAINTNYNYTSTVAHLNYTRNSSALSNSIEKLSSGLRINRAADDGASLSIASKLDSQALGFGQAIRNANDGISIMQIADGSLEEGINILNSIKVKAVQASQDSHTLDTRRIIQKDVDKLLEELDIIEKTANYNDQELLSGIFTNKEFQIGVRPGEQIAVNIDSAISSQIGHVRKAQLSLTNSAGGSVYASFYNNKNSETLKIKSISIGYNNSSDNSMSALADAINLYENETGISAHAVVESSSTDAVQSGSTSSSFAVNGINIGTVAVLDNDSDGSLISAINLKKTSHGVTASTTSSGHLELVSSDGRPIEVGGAGSALTAPDAANMSTFGYVQIYQQGAYSINMTDLSSGLAVAFTSNMDFTGDMTSSIDSTLAASSVLGAASTFTAGSSAGATLSGALLDGDIATTVDSTIKSGSVLATGSILEKSSVTGGSAVNSGAVVTTAYSLIKADSILKSGSILKKDTYLTNEIYVDGSPVAAGQTLSVDSTLSADVTLDSDMLLQNGSTIADASTVTVGSYVGGDLILASAMTTTMDMTMLANSTIKDVDGVTSIVAGSTIGGSLTIAGANITLSQSMSMKSDSVLTAASELATGSTIGGDVVLNGAHTTIQELSLAANSILVTGTVIKTGTELTNDINTTVGTITMGTVADQDYTTAGSNTLSNNMTISSGSIIASDSTLTANSGETTETQLDSESTVRLADISLLSQEDAQTSIEVVDAALNDMNEIRSQVGASQNQFSSSVSYLSGSKINIENASSKMMDVDFADESKTFTKMQILVRSSAFALSQANIIPSNVIDLLQGGSDVLQRAESDLFSNLVTI